MKKQPSLTLKTEQSEDLVKRPLPAPPSDRPSAVLGLVERAALDPRADVEKLERMMAMYERLKAKEAELAYNAAKGRILKIDEVQIKTILDLIKKAKVGPKFLKYMKAQSVEQAGSLEAAVATIAAWDYRKAISTLEEQMGKAEPSHANLSS